jgi:phosphoribosylformylglycinamidine synthase subunit PurS
MKFLVEIDVMPHKALLDPQGKTVNSTLHNIGFKTIEDVRIGKHITFELEAKLKTEATEIVNEVCMKVLSNPIVENYFFKISSL